MLKMFRTLIYPSSGAFDYSVELPHWSYCSSFDVCLNFGVVWLEWYPCCRLKHNCTIVLYYAVKCGYLNDQFYGHPLVTRAVSFCYVKVNQSHYRPEVLRGFQEINVLTLHDNGPGGW